MDPRSPQALSPVTAVGVVERRRAVDVPGRGAQRPLTDRILDVLDADEPVGGESGSICI